MINKAARAIHGESHEDDYVSKDNDDVDFYGYENKSQTSSESLDSTELHCSSPGEFQKRIESIEAEYKSETTEFFDPEWIKKTDESTAKNKISKISESHMRKVEKIR